MLTDTVEPLLKNMSRGPIVIWGFPWELIPRFSALGVDGKQAADSAQFDPSTRGKFALCKSIMFWWLDRS
jgi:hypothetical protein